LSEFNQVREDLIDMLEELENRLERITLDVGHTEKPLAPDFAEQAVETENDPVLEALGQSTVLEIDQIRQALSRIEEGGYGLCQQCGQPIEKERLQALPYTSVCIRCAKNMS
jgi:RNA polymerase-binding transcription factor DksA